MADGRAPTGETPPAEPGAFERALEQAHAATRPAGRTPQAAPEDAPREDAPLPATLDAALVPVNPAMTMPVPPDACGAAGEVAEADGLAPALPAAEPAPLVADAAPPPHGLDLATDETPALPLPEASRTEKQSVPAPAARGTEQAPVVEDGGQAGQGAATVAQPLQAGEQPVPAPEAAAVSRAALLNGQERAPLGHAPAEEMPDETSGNGHREDAPVGTGVPRPAHPDRLTSASPSTPASDERPEAAPVPPEQPSSEPTAPLRTVDDSASGVREHAAAPAKAPNPLAADSGPDVERADASFQPGDSEGGADSDLSRGQHPDGPHTPKSTPPGTPSAERPLGPLYDVQGLAEEAIPAGEAGKTLRPTPAEAERSVPGADSREEPANPDAGLFEGPGERVLEPGGRPEAERNSPLAASDEPAHQASARTTHEARTPRAENPLLARWQADIRGLAAELRAEAGGWQRLRIQLDDDAGTMTVRARREDDRVALNVAFSDPALRQTAQASAERLHAALESQLGQSVDFSFDDGGSQQSPRDGRSHAPASSSSSSSRTAPHATAPRPAPGSAREWIG